MIKDLWISVCLNKFCIADLKELISFSKKEWILDLYSGSKALGKFNIKDIFQKSCYPLSYLRFVLLPIL